MKGRTNWKKLLNMTEKEIEAGAKSDPDAPISSDRELKKFKRVNPTQDIDVKAVRNKRGNAHRVVGITPISLKWISGKWKKLVTGETLPNKSITKVNRRYFELCLFSKIMQELKSGDLYVEGSHDYSDYRDQLISVSVAK